jgi:DNA gyrase subunit A
MYYLFATKKGVVKKTSIEEYQNIRQNGLIAVKLENGDQLLDVKPTTGKDKVLLITAKGKCILFDENDVRPTGRATVGVRGIRIKADDYLVGMDVITAEDEKKAGAYEVLILSSNGYGKKTLLSEYSVQGRGGQGVYTAKLNTKTGDLVAMRVLRNGASSDLKIDDNGSSIQEPSDLLVISKLGQAIRLSIGEVPTLGRHTQGVRIIRLNDKDEATALALL